MTLTQNGKNLISAALFLLLVGAGFMLYLSRQDNAPPRGPGVGSVAPELALPLLGSTEMMSVQQFRGKTVLLDFWATWCPPCREQMPVVQKLEEDPALRDSLQIISINLDDANAGRDAKVAEYLQQNGYTFSVVLGSAQSMSDYGVDYLPTLVLVSPDGTISFSGSGVHTEAELRKLIKKGAK